jgi:putative endonuclease
LLAQCRPACPIEAKWTELAEVHLMYFVYLIECSDGSYYTGITTNIERRFNEHKNKKGGHYTSSKEVIRVVYTEQYPDRSSALKREAQVKGWTRQKKLNLIKFGRP